MKRTRFTEEQIIVVLKEAEARAKTGELARRHGVLVLARLPDRDDQGRYAISEYSPIEKLAMWRQFFH